MILLVVVSSSGMIEWVSLGENGGRHEKRIFGRFAPYFV